ncbi:MAG: carbohydrate ABC transporter substrate-binding protein, partial [Chloroflexi bacterium]|nr:carbohydrate ABC transporter substrate-binding protein [Chloroflexota bacterium]
MDDEAEGDLAGTTVTIFGAFVDEDAERFEASMVPFEERTGIDVVYEGSGDFETQIGIRVDGGDPPDIAAFPQPGLARTFVEDGAVIDVETFLDRAYLEQQYNDVWLNLAEIEDIQAGVWYRANIKSLVWYPVPEFEEAGYEIPETWDDLIALSDQMVADGNTPWCIGMESSGATGWVATDWMEDILLRTAPPETYDAWVNHEIPFNAPEIQRAGEIMAEIWFNEDYVLGGTTAIVTIPFGDAPDPLFEEPPGCFMHRQASFIPAFFPEDAVLGEDVNIFYLPPIDEEYGNPVLGAGDMMSMLVDRPEVRAVMEYMTTGESLRAWAEAGGVVSPHNDFDASWYPTEVDQQYGEILQNATTFRFDASDLMPQQVGQGSFWEEMTEWVNSGDPDNLEEALIDIEESWPE